MIQIIPHYFCVKRFQCSICIRSIWIKTNTEISFTFWLTLFYSIPLLALTDRLTDRQRNKCTRFAWAGGTFFPVVLLCCVSVWFWQEIGYGLHTHVLRVQYSCGVVLVFWLQQEIVFGVMYILSVQYLSVVSKYKYHQSHFNLRKFLLGFFII